MSKTEELQLLETLKNRFEKNINRHPNMEWGIVEGKLQSDSKHLLTLYEMERTGGEPDVVDFDDLNQQIAFVDCSPESPIGRRSLCYDKAGLMSRKEHKPVGSAEDVAYSMGIQILDQAQYLALQKLGLFDTKTSSWIHTPPEIRSLGGALFADHRYGQVFVYHNGAQSYYSSRGFRGILKI